MCQREADPMSHTHRAMDILWPLGHFQWKCLHSEANGNEVALIVYQSSIYSSRIDLKFHGLELKGFSIHHIFSNRC